MAPGENLWNRTRTRNPLLCDRSYAAISANFECRATTM